MAGELVDRTAELSYDDGTGAAWHDVSADALNRDPVVITRGIANEGGSADPGQLGLSLWNGTSNVEPSVSGRYAPRNPRSDLHGLIGPNTPVRLSAGLVGSAQTVRMVGEAVAWPTRRDVSERVRWVPFSAAGVLRRVGTTAAPIQSALRRYFLAMGDRLVGYVPLEDGADVGRTANLVPGQTGPQYFTTPPEFAADDTLAGSRPLPEWPVRDYFGWSSGGSVAPHVPPWAVYVLFRAPAGSGECWLCEWQTDGEDTDWALKISSGGKLQVVTNNDAGTGVTHTSTGASVDDGEWQLGGVVAHQSGGTQVVYLLSHAGGVAAVEGFASGAVVGRVTRIRPRPMFASPSGKDPIGLGHAVVMADPFDVILRRTLLDLADSAVTPLDGWTGEPALDRTDRLCLAEGVDLSSGMVVAADEFGRTESSGWDAADEGGTWSHDGGDLADYTVTPGEALVDIDTLDSGRQSTLAVNQQDVDETVLFRATELVTGTGGEMAAVVVARVLDASNRVNFSTRWFPSGVVTGAISVVVAGTPTLLALTAGTQVAYDDTTVVAVRAQARGNLLRMKLWDVTAPQPALWSVQATDSSLVAGGAVGVRASLNASATNTLPVTLAVRSFAASTAPESAPLGPQPVGEFLDVLADAVKVEAAGSRAPVLVERREAAGLRFNPLVSLYLPRTADLTLDWAEAHVSPPFDGEPDDLGMANDVTAKRTRGGSYRVVIPDGPRGTVKAGTVPREEDYGTMSDLLLPSIAGWWAWHGTHDEDRYPSIRINVRSLSLRTDGAALVAAVQALDPGALVVIENPPDDMPGEQIEQIVLGVTETITADEWTIDLHTTAARPFLVAKVGDATYGITGSDSTTLDEALDTTETGVDVDCGAGADWVHEGTDYDIQIGGERMTVTAVGSASGTFPARTQTLTVTRGVNGIVKSHATGAQVHMWHRTAIGPWG